MPWEIKIADCPSNTLSFFSSQNFKDFIDAENSMPLPTSDIRLPVCMEMRKMHEDLDYFEDRMAPVVPPLPVPHPARTRPSSEPHNGHQMQQYASVPVDHGSVDSTDTFASCNTHPFLSEGDLADGIPEHLFDSNLYVNPLDSGGRVKKSASGDTALRSLALSPLEEGFQGFAATVRGSRGSLNESQVPKHRKARFQVGTFFSSLP